MKVPKTSQYVSRTNIYNDKYSQKKNTVGFKGSPADAVFGMLDKGFGILDKNAMIQVSFVDTVSTNIPRTLVDLKTGPAAALETFRREFSGLFVNCLMPGLIVKGLSVLLPKAAELTGTDVVSSWATSDVTEKLKGAYKSAQNSGGENISEKYVRNVLNSLEGIDGKNRVKYADMSSSAEYNEAVEHLTKAINTKGIERKSLIKKAQDKLASVTKAESILEFNGAPHGNLTETLRDMVDMGEKFNTVKDRTVKTLSDSGEKLKQADIDSKIADAIDKYSFSFNKFVNRKSLIGLGIVIGIAVSIQKINRAITRKQFDSEGAPIYKDFGKKNTKKEMTDEEKKKFNAKKGLAAVGMYALAAASMMKKPSLNMFQFSGIFPTMNQCRWIAASTFASRMLASEDENELRETTVRDIASFSGLYFLGDYVKKGVASGMEVLSRTKSGERLLGKDLTLLNRKNVISEPVINKGATLTEKLTKKAVFRAKQFGNWVKNTELKTAAEVSSTKVRNLRNICRVADIAFSICMLGVILPKYNRKVTEKKVAQAQKLEETAKNPLKNLSEKQKNNIPEIFKNLA